MATDLSNIKPRTTITISKLMSYRARVVMKVRGFDSFSEYIAARIREDFEKLTRAEQSAANGNGLMPAEEIRQLPLKGFTPVLSESTKNAELATAS